MRYRTFTVLIGGLAVLAAPQPLATRALAQGAIQTPGTIQVPRGSWQVPREFQKPRDTWQETKPPAQSGPIQAPRPQPQPIQAPPPPVEPAKPVVAEPPAPPPPPPFETVKETCRTRIVFGADALFAFDKSDLGDEASQTLAQVAATLRETPGPVTIEGHTDSKGSETYNQRLSERRAAAVRSWLAAQGALPAQAEIRGLGESRPIAPNTAPDRSDDPEGRARNRRVEVSVRTCTR